MIILSAFCSGVARTANSPAAPTVETGRSRQRICDDERTPQLVLARIIGQYTTRQERRRLHHHEDDSPIARSQVVIRRPQ